MKLTVVIGAEAMALGQTQACRAGWLSLLDACPWGTGFQHPDFVFPWYRLYLDRFLPVLVLAHAADGRLAGLLPLAREVRSGIVRGAGDKQAEYQVWLADPKDGDDFIDRAVPALRAALPGTDLHLKYLPSGTPLAWCTDVPTCALRVHRRPLMHAEYAVMTKQRNKKNHRQNFNRLSRMGPVVFERVVDQRRFAEILGDICIQYDDRQEALYGHRPFNQDPTKQTFLLELQRSGLLHTSLLTVGGSIAAAHIGLLSHGRAIHLGINTHAPAFAAHSPGQLLLAMLGVHMVDDTTCLLDLTPGGDPYKEHFATGHDLAFELSAYAGARRRLSTELIAGATYCVKSGLRALGYRPGSVLGALRIFSQRSLQFLGGTGGACVTTRAGGTPQHLAKDGSGSTGTGMPDKCLDDA